jgi:hypothetical protein
MAAARRRRISLGVMRGRPLVLVRQALARIVPGFQTEREPGLPRLNQSAKLAL